MSSLLEIDYSHELKSINLQKSEYIESSRMIYENVLNLWFLKGILALMITNPKLTKANIAIKTLPIYDMFLDGSP